MSPRIGTKLSSKHPDGSRKKFRVQNTAEKFRAFAKFLHRLVLPARIGFEPTGNYHRALAYFLHSEGFHLESAGVDSLSPSVCSAPAVDIFCELPAELVSPQ